MPDGYGTYTQVNSSNDGYGQYTIVSEPTEKGYGVYMEVDQDSVVSLQSAEDSSEPSALLKRFFNEMKYFTWTGSGPSGMPLHEDSQRERNLPTHEFYSRSDDVDRAVKLCLHYLANQDDTSAAGFTTWLKTLNSSDSRVVLKLIETWKKIDPSTLAAEPKMVKYLDMEQRQRYVIEFDGSGQIMARIAKPNSGPMEFDRIPYDTTQSKAAFGGRAAMAIWVQSPSGRFYSSTESKAGKFHHSSFLAGRNVNCAGDWSVVAGKLVSISAVSGHYRPPMSALHAALKDIQGSAPAVLASGAVVEYGFDGPNPQKVPVLEFIKKGDADANWLKGLKAIVS